jgi:hypothetical protein
VARIDRGILAGLWFAVLGICASVVIAAVTQAHPNTVVIVCAGVIGAIAFILALLSVFGIWPSKGQSMGDTGDTGDTYKVTSHGQQGGITAGKVTINPAAVPPSLTVEPNTAARKLAEGSYLSTYDIAIANPAAANAVRMLARGETITDIRLTEAPGPDGIGRSSLGGGSSAIDDQAAVIECQTPKRAMMLAVYHSASEPPTVTGELV